MTDEKKPGEIFEMFQKMINPMAFPMQNLMMAGLNVAEIDKKLSELTTVKHWLNSHLGMLDLTIKALEYQRALLAPPSGEKGRRAGTATTDNPLLNPALWPWSFMKPQDSAPASPSPAKPDPVRKPGPKKN